ncbi:hypothetical protein [Rhodococcus pyridinivorans]|uniref:hypothetical protein n=1 Tax=Rhodococcus pyridinivorans TaxID=103816 RepID=UPI0022AFC781|nr:hypothetical protein [Rhodococcus pyridinivorans]
MLDDAGFHGLLISDHLIYPKELKTVYPGHESGKPFWSPETEWPDAWVLIGTMAAVTKNLHFGNNVYIAPSQPILEVAKQVGTAATITSSAPPSSTARRSRTSPRGSSRSSREGLCNKRIRERENPHRRYR